MKLWLDTEFNGWEGGIISMGITSEDGKEFYEVLECVSCTMGERECCPVLTKRFNFKRVVYQEAGAIPLAMG